MAQSQPKGPDDCPEGGKHDFLGKPTACHYLSCCLCLPCLMLCSCMMSQGSAAANPAFEQSCGSGETKEGACRKCQLDKEETQVYWQQDVQTLERREMRKSYVNQPSRADPMSVHNRPGPE